MPFVLTYRNCPACSHECGGWRKKMAEEYKGEAYCVKCKEKRAFEEVAASVEKTIAKLSNKKADA